MNELYLLAAGLVFIYAFKM